MSAKSIKFEISLEKLSVKFEGDIQTAERLQGEITGALNTLASAQHKMLAPAKVAAPPTVDIARGRRGRRRRKGSDGIDPSILDAAVVSNGNGDGDVDDGEGAGRTRRSASGATDLLNVIKTEGFFGVKRTNSEIRDELARKGHTFKSNEVNPILVSLTQKGTLKREKNAEGQWSYFAE